MTHPSPPADDDLPNWTVTTSGFRRTADEATDLFARLDRTGKILYCNPAVTGVTGRPPADYIGKTYWEAGVPPAHCAQWDALIAQVFADGAEGAITYGVDTPQGRRHMDYRLIPERHESGEVASVLVIGRDVTAHKAMEEALRRSEARYRLLAENASDMVATFSADLRFTYTSPSGERITGHAADSLLGQPVMDLIHPEDHAHVLTALGGLRESAETASAVYRYRHADGHYIWLESTGRAVRDPETGELTGYQAASRDVTARQRHETELNVANAELRRLGALKDEFLSTVSHELRTPLAAIRNAVAIVAKEKAGPLNATQARFMGIIRDHVARLHRMVDDVLDLQRLEAGSMPHRPVVADVRPLVLEVVNGYSPAFAERGIQVTVALASEPLTAKFDRDRLAQVLLNLLSNAAKFTPEGGRVTIRGACDAETNTVRLSVADTGVGISPADIPRIFEKFVQADASLTRQVGGTGLGLSICRTIVEGAHGGRLWVESTEGVGTTFHLALPAEAPEETWLDG